VGNLSDLAGPAVTLCSLIYFHKVCDTFLRKKEKKKKRIVFAPPFSLCISRSSVISVRSYCHSLPFFDTASANLLLGLGLLIENNAIDTDSTSTKFIGQYVRGNHAQDFEKEAMLPSQEHYMMWSRAYSQRVVSNRRMVNSIGHSELRRGSMLFCQWMAMGFSFLLSQL
jgi:hypothetical protein